MESQSGTARESTCVACGTLVSNPNASGLCQRCLLAPPSVSHWTPAEPPSLDEVAQALPRFHVTKLIGRGATGAVFEARDRQLSRTVAIKAMRAHTDNPEFAARFAREASALARLNHPHVVTIYDVGVVDDLHYLVMERMQQTLEDELASGTLSKTRVLQILSDICEGVTCAHHAAVIHRDLKPSNILLDVSGRAKVSDFGLVKGIADHELAGATVTKSGMAIGSPFYMAPEQIENPALIDSRADIYGLGAILHKMLTGEPPKPAQDADRNFRRLPRKLAPVVQRALHPQADQRYGSANELFQAAKAQLDPSRVVKQRTQLVALTAVIGLTTGAYFLGSRERIPYHQHLSQEDIAGLPLKSFESEIDLTEWLLIADFPFEGTRDGDAAHKQTAMRILNGASIEEGKLVFTDPEQSAELDLQPAGDDPIKGLALHFRYKADAYPAVSEREIGLVHLELRQDIGYWLVAGRWEHPNPTIRVGRFERLAPHGVIEPHLDPGEWHDVRLVIHNGIRLWIDDRPVYRSNLDGALTQWRHWAKDNPALLSIRGFRGAVDRIRLYTL